MRPRSILLLFFILQFFSFSGYSQQKRETRDSLIRLVEAESAVVQDIEGVSYRKIIGSARFLHNNTYLLCDTALWNVNDNIIKAVGNVQIIQDNTFLLSDRIDYIVEENLAQFRGTLVELYDKEGNVLRTNYLDYNTRDSIGTFFNGGVMKGATGNIIESLEGWYFAYEKLFSFEENVQMFTDSVFIKGNKLEYSTVENKAYFGRSTVAWQEDNILFTNDGEFDREKNIFNFLKDSYILTKDQELWADTLTYYRNTAEAELHGNIQIFDSKQSAYSFADEARYKSAPMSVTLTKNPAVAFYTIENGIPDTMFLAADTLKYYHVRYCDVDSLAVEQAKKRVELSNLDPLIEIEATSAKNRVDNRPVSNLLVPKKQIEPDSSAVEETKELSDKVEKVKEMPDTLLQVSADTLNTAIDTAKVLADSLTTAIDTAKAMTDSLNVAPVDTTAVVFIDAWHNVKVYRSNLQALCDSLVYTGLDSMARLYINPVMWNDVKHQFTSDSMQLVIKENTLSKANLLSNAFVASQEDTVHYNQIKGTEMVAYFKDNDLYRYDALGGASMIFYLQEKGVITIMNQKEGKIISARIKDREIQRIKYIESLKNDAHPVFGLSIEDQRLKGFNWRGAERPKSRFELVDRDIRDTRRDIFKKRTFPHYPYTAIYFPEERDAIMEFKRKSDSTRVAKAIEAERKKELDKMEQDTLVPEELLADSISIKPFRDSTDVAQDSLQSQIEQQVENVDKADENIILNKEERRAIRKAEKIKRREERKEQKRLNRDKRRREKELKKEQRQKRRQKKQ